MGPIRLVPREFRLRPALPAVGECDAPLYSLIGTAKLNGFDPETYLRAVLTRIADHPVS